MINLEILLKAICSVENTRKDKWACRYEHGYSYVYKVDFYAKKLNISLATEICLQSMSYGVAQLMGANFRSLGYSDHLTKIPSDEKLQLDYSMRFLKTIVARFPKLEDAISAYNHGSPWRLDGGGYKNQAYVDAVTSALQAGEWGLNASGTC